jgi:hypothetical protein
VGRRALGGGGSGNLRLVYLDSSGYPYEYIQTPDNHWGSKQQVANPDQTKFQAVKLVTGFDSMVMLIALDVGGRLRLRTRTPETSC